MGIGKTKYTFEFIKAFVEQRGYKLLTNEYEYKNTNTKLKLICSVGHECLITFSSMFHNGTGCKICSSERTASKKRIPLTSVIKDIEVNGFKIISGLEEYKNAYQSRLILECPNGHKWNVTYKGFKANGCYYCGTPKHNLEIAKEEFSKRGYELLAIEYIRANIKMPYICKIHPEKIQYATLTDILRTNGLNCKNCHDESVTGSKSPKWNPNLTDEERSDKRNLQGYAQWRKDVVERDNYICQCCGNRGNIFAHHLNGYHWAVDQRIDVDNGITLCEDCHTQFHKEYGTHNNTKEQFYEFMITKVCELNVIYEENELKDGKNVIVNETFEDERFCFQ